ncbi:MAG: type II toxin-antitoxin system RelE/ParE family toxin [Chloroflexota bacterium]
MYEVRIKRRAQRAWKRLPEKDFQVILRALRGLEENARPRGAEKLALADLWRIRQGDYRIVYSIYDSEKLIIVRRIGHRREIYRSL